MKVAIAGATGLTGAHCLQLLLANDRITEVYAIGRRASGMQHAKLREVLLQNGKLENNLQVDAFICCLGTTIKKAGSREAFKAIDLHLPVYLANQLHHQGCTKAAVVSAMGANGGSGIFYNRVKGQMEKQMQNIGFSALHLLRPSLITGQRQEHRAGENIAIVLSRLIDPLLVGPLRNYRSIPAHTIAKALVHAVLSPALGNHLYQSNDIKILAGQ